MKILITGADGFVGRNLSQTLENIRQGKDRRFPELKIDEILLWDKNTSEKEIETYCREADFVFSFAGVNRPEKNEEFTKGNRDFVTDLCSLLKKHNNCCDVMLASSLQAQLQGIYENSPYGLSKKQGEQELIRYSEETSARVLIYRFPNIFGKWSRPDYNSAVATFCHNIARDLPITVTDESRVMELVYIDDVIEEMIRCLSSQEHHCHKFSRYCFVPESYKVTLGEIVEGIRSFRRFEQNHIVPEIEAGSFYAKLFATYISFIPPERAIGEFETKSDSRGSFTELLRSEKCGQISLNVSLPGQTKGEHWHHSKWEIFIVISGEAEIRMRKVGSEEIITHRVSGEKPQAVYMLPGYTHSIVNLSQTKELLTLMWASEVFDENKPDTFSLKV